MIDLYCHDCEKDVEAHIEEAAVRGTADTVPVYVCNECDETICDVGELEE